MIDGEIIAEPLQLDIEDHVIARFTAPLGGEGDGNLGGDEAHDQGNERKGDVFRGEGGHGTGDQDRKRRDGRPFGNVLVLTLFCFIGVNIHVVSPLILQIIVSGSRHG